MRFQGIIKGIRIKANDIDKYISITIEAEQTADTKEIADLMLKAVNIEITPNEG